MERSDFGEITPNLGAVFPTSLWLRLRIDYTRSKTLFLTPCLSQLMPQLWLSHKVIIQKLSKLRLLKRIDVDQGKLQTIQSHKGFFQPYLSFPVMLQSAEKKMALDY